MAAPTNIQADQPVFATADVPIGTNLRTFAGVGARPWAPRNTPNQTQATDEYST